MGSGCIECRISYIRLRRVLRETARGAATLAMTTEKRPPAEDRENLIDRPLLVTTKEDRRTI